MLRRLAAIALSVLSTAVTVHAANPVDVHGRLQVVGNRIVGEKSGDTVQLAGMSFFWSNWMGQFWNESTVDWLVDDFHCSIVRATMGADFVDASGAISGIASASDIHTGMLLTETVVDEATRRGIYSIIDWHSHHAPAHTADAVKFFDTLATKYGNNPGVVFEIFNEPWSNDYTWAQIKAYANTVIPVIRKHSNNLIVVGSREWSRDLDEATQDPIVDSNVAYVLHFYAGSHRDSLRWQGDSALSRGKAVFVSEWGTTIDDGGSKDKTVYTDESNKWLAWMDSNRISSCNWSVENKAESSAILTGSASTTGGWDTAKDLTTSGNFVRAAIRARNTQYSFGPPPIDSSSLPGRIQAESYAKDSALTKTTNSGADGQYLGNSAVKSWAQWNVTMPQARKVSMALRVASDRTTGLTVKVNGVLVKTTSFPTTGGWGTWATISTDSFQVPAGPITIRIDWTNVFDLDWFELHGRATDTGVVTPPDTTQVDTTKTDSTKIDSARIQAETYAKDSLVTKSSNAGSDGQYLGNSQVGSWAQWTLSRSDPTMVSLSMRVASDRTTGLVVKVDGVQVTKKTFPTTGGWGTWATIQTDSFRVPSGAVTVRVEWTDVFDLDWFELNGRLDTETVPPPDTAHGDSLRVYALSNTAIDPTSGLKITGTGDAGYLSWSANGSWAEFSLTSSAQEKAVIAMRYATPQDTAKVALKINGIATATVKLPNTGAWGDNATKWSTATSDSIQVPSGAFKLRLTWIGQFDLNWLELRAPNQMTGVRLRSHKELRALCSGRTLLLDLPAAGRVQVLDVQGRSLFSADVPAGTSSLALPSARGRLFVRWITSREMRTLPVMAF